MDVIKKENEKTPDKIKAPRPLVPLNREGKKIYRIVSDQLIGQGTYKPGDAILVSMLSHNIQLWMEVARGLQGQEDMIIDYGGNKGSNITGQMVAYNHTQKNIVALLEKLGIGPRVQTRMFKFVQNQLALDFSGDKYFDLSEPVDISAGAV